MLDVKTGYIPYVEDSTHPNRLPYAQALQKNHEDLFSKKNALGLCKYQFEKNTYSITIAICRFQLIPLMPGVMN